MFVFTTDTACQYDHIVFDLDSTLVSIEGVDELARMKGVEHLVAPITQQAMNGEYSIDEAFQKRLELIRPTVNDVSQLTDLYIEHLVPGSQELIAWLQELGKTVYVVSGGYDPAVSDFARELGVRSENVYANKLVFNETGEYRYLEPGFLSQENGKRELVRTLKDTHSGRWALIGDGMSDLETESVIDRFICFAGIAQREAVIQQAECVIYENDLRMLQSFL